MYNKRHSLFASQIYKKLIKNYKKDFCLFCPFISFKIKSITYYILPFSLFSKNNSVVTNTFSTKKCKSPIIVYRNRGITKVNPATCYHNCGV